MSIPKRQFRVAASKTLRGRIGPDLSKLGDKVPTKRRRIGPVLADMPGRRIGPALQKLSPSRKGAAPPDLSSFKGAGTNMPTMPKNGAPDFGSLRQPPGTSGPKLRQMKSASTAKKMKVAKRARGKTKPRQPRKASYNK